MDPVTLSIVLPIITKALGSASNKAKSSAKQFGAIGQTDSTASSGDDIDVSSLVKGISSLNEKEEDFLEDKRKQNREDAEDFGDSSIVTSDMRLKALYTQETGKHAPADATVEEKEEAIRTGKPIKRETVGLIGDSPSNGELSLVNPHVQPENPSDSPKDSITGGGTTESPNSDKPKASSKKGKGSSEKTDYNTEAFNQHPQNDPYGYQNLNKELSNIMTVEMLSRLLGSSLAEFATMGAIGTQPNSATSKEDVTKAIGSIASIAGTHSRQQLARNAMAKERAIMDARVRQIEQTDMSEEHKQEYIRSVRKSYENEIEKLQRTLGLYQITPAERSILSDHSSKNISAKDAAKMLRNRDLVLSDQDCKILRSVDPIDIARELHDLGGPFSSDELEFLHNVASATSGEEYAFDIADAGIWSPETLDGYASYIKNSLYNYKPEATEIDPSIDPTEEQIGPMAQEIEKVNPAVIVENEDGVKQVDTNKLSMMNAGVIGDLARENNKIIELLESIGSRLDRLEGGVNGGE